MGPYKKMPHRRFEHVQAIKHPIDVFRANVLLRLAKQRAEDCHLADRFRRMAADLLAKAEDFEDLQALRFRREDSKKLAAA